MTAQTAKATYEASKGVGNSRATVERLRREWVLAVAREAAVNNG